MSTCVIPANQLIYQALLDKAASYPVDKPYQAKAYKNAAESVLNYDKNIYIEYEPQPNIGNKIEEFIYQFIHANSDPIEPVKPVEEPVWTWADYLAEGKKSDVYTAESPRRSKRISCKPAPKYFDDDDEIIEAMESICDKNGYTYSDELMNDFNAWLPTVYKTSPMNKTRIAKSWVKYNSTNIQTQKKQKQLNKCLIQYCKKNNYEYTNTMANKFIQWMNDPVNKTLITYTITTINNGSYRNKIHSVQYIYDRSPKYCINMWLSSVKKTIV